MRQEVLEKRQWILGDEYPLETMETGPATNSGFASTMDNTVSSSEKNVHQATRQ
jgi:hypothetical protein